MRKINWLVIIISLGLTLLPAITVYAQALPTIPCPPGLNCSLGLGNGVNSINNFVLTIIGWLTGIAFGIAVLFLIIGGFLYITSGGNEESAEKAKATIINAIIGIILIILSYVIISVIVNLLSSRTATGP